MARHIIFKGKEHTGKSLFAKIIFGNEKVLKIAGYKSPSNHDFIFDNGSDKWDYDYILIDDPRKKSFDISEFYEISSREHMIINIKFYGQLRVKTPKFIFLINSDVISLPENNPTFIRRFKVLDFDKNPISDLMKIIHEEKIIIKTAP